MTRTLAQYSALQVHLATGYEQEARDLQFAGRGQDAAARLELAESRRRLADYAEDLGRALTLGEELGWIQRWHRIASPAAA